MRQREKERLSTYLCYLLRHAPEVVGLDMDGHGWVSVARLIETVNREGKGQLTEELLQEIVATDKKGRYRFSSDGKRVKACQGHSIPWVEPEAEIRTPPERLYHGTTTEALNDIMKSGAVLKMRRHAVHLQADSGKAWQSAMRRKHKVPVVLVIAAGEMHRNGVQFRISENGVWLCERVPTEYIAGFLYEVEGCGEESGTEQTTGRELPFFCVEVGRPLFLSINGKIRYVVLDLEEYRLYDCLREDAVKRTAANENAGCFPLEEVMKELGLTEADLEDGKL